MDSFTKRALRTNKNSERSTPATQNDAPEPQRRGLSGQKPPSTKSGLQPQDDESDDQNMDLDDDEQPQDDRSNDQDMNLDEDDDGRTNTAIDQNDKQVNNAKFDETDSEDIDNKCPEEIAFMNDPANDQIRSEMRQWAHEETSENVNEEMIRLTAFLCDLDEKEENREKYRYTEQRGLNADDLRDREIAMYKRKWARKRYWHDKLSIGKLFDPSADDDASEDAPIRKIVMESSTHWLVAWENSWIHRLSAKQQASEHYVIRKIIDEKTDEKNRTLSLVQWENSWVDWVTPVAKREWNALKKKEDALKKRENALKKKESALKKKVIARQRREKKTKAQKNDASDGDALDEDRMEGLDDV
jgi:hypothetical protein